ncbi:retrovirus-related pol polyprotein from transposon TNT 1-94 [Tanacetum coccineum]
MSFIMTIPITTTTANSQMHNDIMAAGLRDRPPMLATGRYAQWQSQIKIPAQPATDDSPKVPERTVLGTFLNISPENKAHYDAEAEAIHLILTRIGDEIYSTVDACTTAKDMWIAIERIQWVSLLTSRMSRLICFRNLASSLPEMESKLSLTNQDTYYQAPKSLKSYETPARTSSSNRSHVTTKTKDKEIAKPITPPSESASEEDSDPEQPQRDKDMAKETVGMQVVLQSGIECFNCKEFRHFAKECRKPKQEKGYTYHKEKILLCKQAEKGVSLYAEQTNWLDDTDEEMDEQELEAHYIQHYKEPESINDTYVVEKVNSTVIPDPSDMCNNEDIADQNANECDDECVVLDNLITNLKLNSHENKKI